jgi:hypothetical protein
VTNLPAKVAGLDRPSPFKPLDEMLLRLADEADALAEAGNLATLGFGLHDLRRFRKALTDLEHHIEGHVTKLMSSNTVNFGDELVLERHGGAKRTKWDSEELLRHLIGDAVNPDTGERVFDTLLDTLPIRPSTSWRTTGLKAHGVRVDDWCEKEPGRTTVQVHAKGDDSE